MFNIKRIEQEHYTFGASLLDLYVYIYIKYVT